MKKATKSTGLRAILITLSIGSTSCSGILTSDSPADKVYWLEALVVEQPVVNSGAQPSLAVSVSAAPGMDTDRLLILGPTALLSHYAQARWPDNIPEVLESLLRSTLESSGRYSRVTTGTISRSSDWVLELEVRELYALATERGSAQTVRLVIRGYLFCPKSDRSILLRADSNIGNNRLSDIVAAYQRAVDEASRQLVDQLANACSDSKTNID